VGLSNFFVKYRTDQLLADGDGFIEDAERLFASGFEKDAS